MKDTIRRITQILWWAGLAGLVVGLLGFLLPVRIPAGLLIGIGLMLLAVNMLLGGDLTVGADVRTFTVRGQVVRGQLLINAGLSDVTIGTCERGRIASVQHGPIGKPAFEVLSDVATLRLGYPINISQWRTDLANNLLWDIKASSLTGHYTVNLAPLRVDHFRASTALGQLRVNCPTRGYSQLELKTAMGEIDLRLPPEVGARIQIQKGQLATLTIHNERLLALGSRRYATPDYDDAQAQMDILIETAAGDIILR